jgi:hypothetical protein
VGDYPVRLVRAQLTYGCHQANVSPPFIAIESFLAGNEVDPTLLLVFRKQLYARPPHASKNQQALSDGHRGADAARVATANPARQALYLAGIDNVRGSKPMTVGIEPRILLSGGCAGRCSCAR